MTLGWLGADNRQQGTGCPEFGTGKDGPGTTVGTGGREAAARAREAGMGAVSGSRMKSYLTVED